MYRNKMEAFIPHGNVPPSGYKMKGGVTCEGLPILRERGIPLRSGFVRVSSSVFIYLLYLLSRVLLFFLLIWLGFCVVVWFGLCGHSCNHFVDT